MTDQCDEARPGLAVGVDVGGTFTDLIALDQTTGQVHLAKVPSTPDNQAFGVLAAFEATQIDLASVDLIVHGTTTTTNAVLERKLAKTGLITTRGFRDILELGRRTRPQAYGMHGVFEPVIPRDLRLEVDERMDAAGDVLVPLSEDGLKAAARSLLDAGCQSVVIHFLHAYANPAHELRAHEIVSEIWPNDYITLGHRLLSESREFERGVTAAVNASVQPLLERYVGRLREELSAHGYPGDVLVMNGNGGMVSSALVAREAAKTVMSGPASGVIAAAYTGSNAGYPDLITYDMGGTSTDVALINGGVPSVSNEIEIEYAMPIHVPMVDVRTVGAGGGSIAKINAAGLLEIGPQSAGAVPGPVCYGRGGTEPTISDANLLLGRLNPTSMTSVSHAAQHGIVEQVISDKLAAPLNVSPIEAAAAVIRLVNTKMAGAIRMVSLSLGADPRDYALFAFGGAGALHACALARELSIPKVLLPGRPGLTNAIGCVVADLRHDFVKTVNRPLDAVDEGDLHRIFNSQMREGIEAIEKETVEIEETSILFSVDMQFVGQTHLIHVPLDDHRVTRALLRQRFEQAYDDRFQVQLDNIQANLVNLKCSVIGRRRALDLSTLIDATKRKQALSDAETSRRQVYFNGGWHDTPIYWRDNLPANANIAGPAIIEQMDTTIVIEPDDHASGDENGNLVIEIGS